MENFATEPFDVSSASKHTRFKEAIELMQKQAFFQIKEVKDKGYEMTNLAIFLKYVIIDVTINFCGDIGRIFYVI